MPVSRGLHLRRRSSGDQSPGTRPSAAARAIVWDQFADLRLRIPTVAQTATRRWGNERPPQILHGPARLLINRDQAKVWPVSEYDRGKEGKRISKHPLHDTFIGPGAEQQREAFYDKAKRGALVAEIDESRSLAQIHITQKKRMSEAIERVQRVLTMKLASLESEWTEIARDIHRGRTPGL